MAYREDIRMIKALADENRLKVLETLQGGEKCACVLLEELNITQSTLSHHMKLLVDSGIVECRKDSRWMYYKLSPSGSRAMLDMVAHYLQTSSDAASCTCSETR